MDVDNILTVFIMIMFQRILNKLDEVEAFFVVQRTDKSPRVTNESTMLTKMPNSKLNKKQRDKRGDISL